MKHRQEESNSAKTNGPSNNNNRNLEENKEKSGLPYAKSESKSDVIGNVSGGKAVFFRSTRPTKKDNPHNNADENPHDKFPPSLTKLEQREEVVDELDLQLLNLLLKGYDNKRIAYTVDNPLSTIQRRTRLIFERGLANSKVELDYKRLGFKKGFLAIRLKGGKIQSIVERLQRMSGIITISANIGTFPVTCTIMYKSVAELWKLISSVQELDNVVEVLWSEEVYNYHSMQNIKV